MLNRARRVAPDPPNPTPAKVRPDPITPRTAAVEGSTPTKARRATPSPRAASRPVINDFDDLADSVLLDDRQLGEFLSYSVETIKVWRQRGIGPQYVSVYGRPRVSVGAVRKWLSELPIATR